MTPPTVTILAPGFRLSSISCRLFCCFFCGRRHSRKVKMTTMRIMGQKAVAVQSYPFQQKTSKLHVLIPFNSRRDHLRNVPSKIDGAYPA